MALGSLSPPDREVRRPIGPLRKAALPSLHLDPPPARLRTLLLTPSLSDSGAGRAVVALALGLDRARFAPAVCCYESWGPLAAELAGAGIEAFPLHKREGLDAAFVWSLARELRNREVDVVHTLGTHSAHGLGALAAFLARTPRRLATVRRAPVDGRRTAGGVARLCGEVLDAVVATSPAVGSELLDRRWVPPGKTRVLPEGVDAERLNAPELRATARSAWGASSRTPVVGAVLTGPDAHALPELLEAFGHLRRWAPEALLAVAGVRGEEPGRPGVIAAGREGDSAAFYAALDAMVPGYARSDAPLALLEALAAGLPVVALAPGDAATGGGTLGKPWSFAALAGGPVALARAMRLALGSSPDLLAARRAARDYVRRAHSMDAYARRVQELYAGA